jgi:hypothetical protein
MMVPNVKSTRRGVVHSAGQIRLLRCGTGTTIYEIKPGDSVPAYEYTREPITCAVCLKMSEHPGPREEIPLTGCRKCGELPGKHWHGTNHPYELPTDFQVLVRSSIRRGGGYLVEIPDHVCNSSTLTLGHDEVDRVMVVGSKRVIVKVKVEFQDHTCNVCGALQRRDVLDQKVK